MSNSNRRSDPASAYENEGDTRTLARALEAEREGFALREEGAPAVPYRGYTGRFYGRRNERSEEGSFDIHRFMAVMRRRRRLMTYTALGVLVLGTVATLLQKKVYKATGQMMVSSPTPSSGSGNSLLSDFLGGGQSRSVGTQIAVLQSTPVMEGALKRLSPSDQTEAERFMRFDVAPVPGAEIIGVSVLAHDAQLAARAVNALCDEYISESRRQGEKQVQDTTAYVASQIGPARERLDNAASALRKYQESNGTVDVSVESSARIASAGQIESDQRQATADRAAAVARVSKLRQEIDTQSVKEESSSVTGVSPNASALQAQITQLEIERIKLTREYLPQSREVQDLDKQLGELRRRLQNESQVSVSSRTQSVNPIRQQLRQDLATTETLVRSLDAKIAALSALQRNSNQKLERIPERAYRLGQLQLDKEVYQQAYKTLVDRYQQLRISKEASQTNVHMIAPADIPLVPVSPRLKLNILASLILGMLAALAGASLAERLDTRLHSDEEVEDAADLPILAHVPFIRSGADKAIIGPRPHPTPALESYRMLRTNIEFASLDEPVRSLVVTSSQPGEGKSLSSANLACVLALSGKSVILVDCDLRRPRQHDLFNVPNTVGFTNVVVDRMPLEKALQETSVPGLRILTSGPLPPNPPEILDSRAGQTCLKELTEYADIVVIDTPPGLSMADAHIVAMNSDAVLMVVSAPDAGRREVTRTTDLLAQSGARMLGVVLNKITAQSKDSYGYFGSSEGNHQLDGGGHTTSRDRHLAKS